MNRINQQYILTNKKKRKAKNIQIKNNNTNKKLFCTAQHKIKTARGCWISGYEFSLHKLFVVT
jgi:hypothetical protein